MANPLGALMKCGHSAQGTIERDGQRIPACIICAGSGRFGWDEPADELPNLRGRMARCEHYGQKSEGSNFEPLNREKCKRGEACMCEEDSQKAMAGGLPFFEYLPNRPFDKYYCGCFGWE